MSGLDVHVDGPKFEVPRHLVDAILSGRCVAFVGAGFSAGVVPAWRELLLRLTQQERPGNPEDLAEVRRRLEAEGGKAHMSGHELEMIGQVIKNSYLGDSPAHGDESAWIKAVHDALQDNGPDPRGCRADLEERKRHLREIPFKVILTTNYDAHLQALKGEPFDLYQKILREPAALSRSRTNGERPSESSQSPSSGAEEPVAAPLALKLHGDAAPEVFDSHSRLVLSRSDYRKLLYEDSRYGSFLRSVFATHTILFLGVSFSDAYLNELRSEVLAMLGARRDNRPWGYAVLCDQGQAWSKYMREHEGIHCLTYPSDQPADRPPHQGFTHWLRAIREATSWSARVARILNGRMVVWVDPKEGNNVPGVRALEEAKAHVVQYANVEGLEHHQDLSSVPLIITAMGYRDAHSALAFDVLDHLRALPQRPPVIVFASGHHAEENRDSVIRRGAWEYASRFDELGECIDLLFNRLGPHTAS